MIQITRPDNRVRLRIPPATLEIRELPNVAHQPAGPFKSAQMIYAW
jgi:hypothetical protein